MSARLGRRLVPAGAGLALAVAIAPAASAHLLNTGMGPLYDGATHAGLTVEDVLPVAALGLFLGLRGPAAARRSLLLLPAAWFAGGCAAQIAPAAPPAVLMISTAALFLAIGLLLAANVELGATACLVLTGLLGVLRGLADFQAVAPSGRALLNLLGAAGAVFAGFAIAASVSLPLKRLWMVVAARVAGSWLAAAGLLLAGWVLRYGARIG